MSQTRTARPGALIVVLAFSGITAAVMQTLVLPVLGELPDLLHTSASNAAWVITATLLMGAIATPVTGRLGDLYGKRRMMIVCSAFLAGGSVLCAFSDTVGPMIVGRGLQGAGMGLIPLGISAMRDLIPAEKLGSAIAVMSASMGIGGALGVPAAAAIAEHADWHMLFWLSTALAVIVLVLIVFLIPATPITAHGTFDFVGAIGLSIALVCLLLPVTKGADWGWSAPPTVLLLVAAPLIFIVWGVYELRIEHPLVDLRTTARPVVLLTNLASIVVGFGMFAMSLVVPQIMQIPSATGYGLGQSMLAMGLWMLPGGFMMMAVSSLGARISHARGPKVTLALGSLVIAAGYFACLGMMGSTWGIMVAMMIANAGVGLAYGAMPALIMGSVPISETAAANAFNTLMRSIGTSASAAIVGVVLAGDLVDFGGHAFPSEASFQWALALGAGGALLAALLAAVIPSRASREAEDHIEHPELAEQ